jgi:hypothetical protein
MLLYCVHNSDSLSFYTDSFFRTFTKDAIAGANKDRCGERLATTIAGHETRVTTTSMRGRCSASTATHKAPSRHGACLHILPLLYSLYCMIMMLCRVVFGADQEERKK